MCMAAPVEGFFSFQSEDPHLGQGFIRGNRCLRDVGSFLAWIWAPARRGTR